MRALIGLFAFSFLLVPAVGCGDALDLGQSGSAGAGSLNQCSFTPNAGACSTCDSPGARCGMSTPQAARAEECCCGAGLQTGAPGVWQCFINPDACPASPPALGSTCQFVDTACQYCTEAGTVSYTCANAAWQGGQRSQGC